jgi:UDP-N-acetylmuramoyl-L-alanyl-D-glutamate--2,6-diaminopimelate ligase
MSRKHLNVFHKLEAMFWSARFGFPARGVKVFGITGTKGKTSTCHLLSSILTEAGYTVGMATTVDFQIGETRTVNETNKSVLHPKLLHQFLREAREQGVDALVLEVTSHSIDQFRVWGIPFQYVGFTNLGHDHLDYHESMDAYRDTKLKLFTLPSVKVAVINTDDAVGEYFIEQTTASKRWGTSCETLDPHPRATDHLAALKLSASASGSSATLTYGDESQRVRLQLPGKFSMSNALIASGLAMAIGVRLGTVVAGLEKVTGVPGRMERLSGRGFDVIIDYAHTPDSLEALYHTLRPDVRGRMIAVFGCTGNRDKTKRPIMGAIAARFCDEIILTDEEPYDEEPERIMNEIAAGVPRGRALFQETPQTARRRGKPPLFKQASSSDDGEGEWWWRMVNRKEAIAFAISRAKLDDVIVITGMGAQTKRIVKGIAEPWNEREIVTELLHL